MHFYSVHVIVEYNQAGSEIICRQIHVQMHDRLLTVISALNGRNAEVLVKITDRGFKMPGDFFGRVYPRVHNLYILSGIASTIEISF